VAATNLLMVGEMIAWFQAEWSLPITGFLWGFLWGGFFGKNKIKTYDSYQTSAYDFDF